MIYTNNSDSEDISESLKSFIAPISDSSDENSQDSASTSYQEAEDSLEDGDSSCSKSNTPVSSVRSSYSFDESSPSAKKLRESVSKKYIGGKTIQYDNVAEIPFQEVEFIIDSNKNLIKQKTKMISKLKKEIRELENINCFMLKWLGSPDECESDAYTSSDESVSSYSIDKNI